MTRHAGLGIMGIGLIVIALVVVSPTSQQESATPAPEAKPLMQGLRFESFDCGQRQVVVEAARARAGRQRIGFLQTALMPTLELEQVRVTIVREDGTTETRQAPFAIMDWRTKTVSSPSGTLLVRLPSSPQHATLTQPASPQGFCQG